MTIAAHLLPNSTVRLSGAETLGSLVQTPPLLPFFYSQYSM